jgi:hypothetical protein
MRLDRFLFACLALLGVTALSRPVAAQEATAAPAEAVVASALMITEGGATDAQAAIVSIGLRRGLAEVPGIDFVHPVDVLSPPQISEDLQFSMDELDARADQVRDGDARDVMESVDVIIQQFEANLEAVRREQLIDAYMIGAVARCRLHRQRECEEMFARVVTFREQHEYDAQRFPAEYADVFNRVRTRVLAGPRSTLLVQTEPAGAEVYVDGRSYGPSPVTVPELLVGDHYVTLKHIASVKTIRRASVTRAGATVSYTLTPNERSRLVASPEAQRSIRGELGEERAGSAIRSLGNTLGAAQVVIGVVTPETADAVHVHAYLYDMRTRFLLSQREATMTLDDAGMDVARQLGVDIYQGVDLSGAIAAPEEALQDTVERRPELYEEWWFWTIIGAAAVGVAVGVGVGVGTAQPGVPDGWTRLDGQF